MAKQILTKEDAQAAVLGGCVLGGGGGGSRQDGLKMALQAVSTGTLTLVDGEDLPEDALLVNVSAVGAPSAKDSFAQGEDYAQAVRDLCRYGQIQVSGVTSNEAGGIASVNGWIQGALLGLPVVDLPSNGRAHPTGVMGAMGLHKLDDYQSIQAAVGGNPALHKRIELVVKGNIQSASAQVRSASVEAGGFVAVARNPVTVAYAMEHGAPGVVKKAIALGKQMLAAQQEGGQAVLKAVLDTLGGELLHQGTIQRIDLTCRGGFDVGTAYWEGFELTFWNEYMTAEKDGQRLGTFPDLLMTLERETGMPVTSAELQEGLDVFVIRVPKEKLTLGAGMRDPQLMKGCEEAVGKEMLSYIFDK